MLASRSFIGLVLGLSLLVYGCKSTQSGVDYKQQAAILRLTTKIATMKYYEKDWNSKKQGAAELKKFLLDVVYNEAYISAPGVNPPFLNVDSITITGTTVAVVKSLIEQSSLKYADKELAKDLVNVLAPYLDDAIKIGNAKVETYYLDYARVAVSGVTTGIDFMEHQNSN